MGSFIFSGEFPQGMFIAVSDSSEEILRFDLNAVAFGVISRRASYFDYDGNTYQGVNKLTEALRNDEALIEKLKKEIISLAGVKND